VPPRPPFVTWLHRVWSPASSERVVAPLVMAAVHLPRGLGFWEGLAGASLEQKQR